MKILSGYIAPWALPKENFPFHLYWEPDCQYDCIVVKLPKDLIITNIFNVEDFEKKDSTIIIKKLKTLNFFSFILKMNKLIKEKHWENQIKIDFLLNNEILYSHFFRVNIYRPVVEVTEVPDEIIITDQSNLKSLLSIGFKISGFGQIKFRIETRTGGEFVTRLEPLYEEIIRRVITQSKLDEKKEKTVEIDPNFLRKATQECIEKIENGKLSPIGIDKETMEEFREWVTDTKNRAKVMKILSRHAEKLIIESLLFYFESYPTENVQLVQGRPITFIEKATRELVIRFFYADAIMNVYEPIVVRIPVKDQRTEMRSNFLPINMNWSQKMLNPLVEGVK